MAGGNRTIQPVGGRHWRHAARVLAVQALYQLDVQGDDFAPLVRRFIHDRLDMPDADELFVNGRMPDDLNMVEAEAIRLCMESWQHRDRARVVMQSCATNWQPDRLSPLDRTVLLLAITELHGVSDAPAAVIIDEAIEMARLFGGADSPRFVNGVLDAARRYIASHPVRAEAEVV